MYFVPDAQDINVQWRARSTDRGGVMLEKVLEMHKTEIFEHDSSSPHFAHILVIIISDLLTIHNTINYILQTIYKWCLMVN